MPQEGRLAGHVRAGKDYYLLAFGVQLDVVGHILLAGRHLRLDNRVAPLGYFEHCGVVHNGTHVAVLRRREGKGAQAVDVGQYGRVELQGSDELQGVAYQLLVQAGFKGEYPVLGAENLFFQFLQLRRDVSFGIDERLLAYPRFGNALLVGVPYLDVVTEHVVEAYLEARNAGFVYLALLYFEQYVLAGMGYAAQFVELGIHPVGYDAAF